MAHNNTYRTAPVPYTGRKTARFDIRREWRGRSYKTGEAISLLRDKIARRETRNLIRQYA